MAQKSIRDVKKGLQWGNTQSRHEGCKYHPISGPGFPSIQKKISTIETRTAQEKAASYRPIDRKSRYYVPLASSMPRKSTVSLIMGWGPVTTVGRSAEWRLRQRPASDRQSVREPHENCTLYEDFQRESKESRPYKPYLYLLPY